MWSHHLSWPFLCGCYLVGFSFCSLPPFYLTSRNLFGLPVFSRALMSWLLTDILLPQSSQNSSLHPHPSFHVPALVCDLWSLSTNLNYWHFWAFEWCLAGFFWCVWQWWHYWQQQGPVHTHPLKKKRFSFKTVVTKKEKYKESFQCSELKQGSFSTLHWGNSVVQVSCDVESGRESSVHGWTGKPDLKYRSNNQRLARCWMGGKDLAVTYSWWVWGAGGRALPCMTRRKNYLEWEGQDFCFCLVEL